VNLISTLLLLVLRRLRTYHLVMRKILRSGDMEVEVFTTPSGVTGYVDTSLSADLINALIEKLEARRKARFAGDLRVDENGEFVSDSAGPAPR
jgi:hypothetical protein